MLLIIASPAGPQYYKILKLADIVPYLDYINLMAYDYAGFWDSVTGYQANLYPSFNNSLCTPFSIQAAIEDYLKAGVPANIIILDMPLYGREFK